MSNLRRRLAKINREAINLKQDIIRTYDTAIKAGQKVEINKSLPYISIDINDHEQYFFQGEEAQSFIDEFQKHVEEGTLDSVTIEQWILWQAQGW